MTTKTMIIVAGSNQASFNNNVVDLAGRQVVELELTKSDFVYDEDVLFATEAVQFKDGVPVLADVLDWFEKIDQFVGGNFDSMTTFWNEVLVHVAVDIVQDRLDNCKLTFVEYDDKMVASVSYED